MLSKPLNKGDFFETHVVYRLALIYSIAVQTDNLRSKLPTKTHQMHHSASKMSFSDTYVMQKNSRCIEIEKMSKVILQSSLLQPSKFNVGKPT